MLFYSPPIVQKMRRVDFDLKIIHTTKNQRRGVSLAEKTNKRKDSLPTNKNNAKNHIEIKSLPQYIKQITKYTKNELKLKCYRGQHNSEWENIPSLFRPNMKKFSCHEKQAVRDLIAVHPAEFADDETMFDRLVRMQHFGLPTRLLDVSKNPLVALYFATEFDPKKEKKNGKVTAFAIPKEREKYFDSDSVSCIANLANMTEEEKKKIFSLRKSKKTELPNKEEVYKRLHQFIRNEKPYFLPIIKPIDLFKPYYVHPKMSNRRILSQSGGFIIFGIKPPKKINYTHELEETEFLIPFEKKEKIRNQLEIIGISNSTIFPELGPAADRIIKTYSTQTKTGQR